MRRVIMLILAVAVIFGAVVTIMLKLMPSPLKDSDYFLIGSVATLLSLGVLFVLIVATTKGASDLLFKRRRKTR